MVQERPRSRERVRQWYVTASHRVVPAGGSDVPEVPYGTSHLRKVGAATTGCGLPAMYWPIFWDLAIQDAAELCNDCKWAARLESGQ